MLALVRSGDAQAGVALREVPEPEPAPDEAIVAVGAVSVNRGELTLLGIRPDGWRPGQDVGGVILRPAADGSGPPEGTAVVAWVDQAGWAERVAARTGRVVALPETVPVEAAATLPVAGLTALRTLRIGGHLLGHRVLITGAAGGVGRFAVQIAAMLGAEVVAVARNAERASGLEDLGAAEVVHEVDSAAGPFDLILESAGGPSLSAAVERLSEEGVLVLFGNSSKEPTEIRFEAVRGLARVHAFRIYESGEPPPFAADLARLVTLLASGRLRAEIGFQGSWRDPAPALHALRDRRVNGKAILRVDGR
ncbi:MAG TPA: zinc-binding dehydrogenase [Actinomycetota bacterium]|nr:zinc-binding dehydrogenase [Actinomycetota bacterium]